MGRYWCSFWLYKTCTLNINPLATYLRIKLYVKMKIFNQLNFLHLLTCTGWPHKQKINERCPSSRRNCKFADPKSSCWLQLINVPFQNHSSERIQITQRVTKTILFPVFKWVCTQAWYRFGFIRSSCRIIFSIKETSSIQYPLSTRLCYNIYIKSGIWRKDTHVICTVKLLILQKD